MDVERYQRLITRDKMKSELIPYLTDFRPEIQTAMRPIFKGLSSMSLEEAPMEDMEIQTRRYRFKRRIVAEIYEYEEY